HLFRTRSVWRLFVKRLPIPYAALHELRPFRHHGNRVSLLRQEFPQRWMMPAQFMPATVPVLPDGLSQSLDFLNKLLARHVVEVRVHNAPALSAAKGT